MRILIANDDGIASEGLRALAAACAARHEVYIAAPWHEQSGMAHALNVHRPIEVEEMPGVALELGAVAAWRIAGTPTDCVKLALSMLLEKKPDIVMSGINAGPNVGPDILYSGTVGAATEACHQGLASMAFSNDDESQTDIQSKARHAVALAESIDWSRIPKGRVINVNYPKGPLTKNRGLRVCRQTTAVWKNDYLERRDPRGSRYWWLMGEIPPETINAGSDKDLLSRGFITVTPLRFDFTDEDTIRVLDALQLPEN